MKVAHVNTSNATGGAAWIMDTLCAGFDRKGHITCRVVGRPSDDDVSVIRLDDRPSWREIAIDALFEGAGRHVRGTWRLLPLARRVSRPISSLASAMGLEDYHYPISRNLLRLLPWIPDVVHLHNLHGGYFDLRGVPSLSGKVPVVLTLHDAWLLGGHCAHSVDCERWMTGCGRCPSIGIYVPIRRDASALNWRRKKNLYERSSLAVAMPCHWLLKKVEQSILAPAVRMAEVIPHGVDPAFFRPGDRCVAREALHLRNDALVLMAVVKGGAANPWRDYKMLLEVTKEVAKRRKARETVLLLVGDEPRTEHHGGLRLESIGVLDDAAEMLRCYQSADLYLHLAKADTFPTTILESLACGLPVIATAVDGIPEQVNHGVTGMLVDRGAVMDAVEGVLSLVGEPERLSAMRGEARDAVLKRFSRDTMVDKYLSLYDRWRTQHAARWHRHGFAGTVVTA